MESEHGQFEERSELREGNGTEAARKGRGKNAAFSRVKSCRKDD